MPGTPGTPGCSGCQGFVGQALQALAWTGVGGRSRLVDPEGPCVERWDGKSGHGAESVRHAEISMAATGDRSGLSGLVRTCQTEPVSWLVVGLVPGSCGG